MSPRGECARTTGSACRLGPTNRCSRRGSSTPLKTISAEEWLWWYSRFFDVVEVNSSFYVVPSPDTAALWVERTPAGFLFYVKAYGLLTGHQVDIARILDELRKLLPAKVRGNASGRVAAAAFGEEGRRWAFAAMQKAWAPLRVAGKLGYVLLQLAPWVTRSAEAEAYLERLPGALPATTVAVEFRNSFGSASIRKKR